MSKFKLHTQGTLFGAIPFGGDETETDSELAARFYLITGLTRATGSDVPPGVQMQVHAHSGDAAEGDEDDMNLTTILLTASAISGEPYEEWVVRAEQFRAEHDGDRPEGLRYDEETNTVVLIVGQKKEQEIKEAREASENLDDEWDTLLASVNTDDAPKED